MTMRQTVARAETEACAIELVHAMWRELKRINRAAADDWCVEHDSGSRIRVTVASGDGPWHTVREPANVLAALKTIAPTKDEGPAGDAIENAFSGRTYCGATAAEMED